MLDILQYIPYDPIYAMAWLQWIVNNIIPFIISPLSSDGIGVGGDGKIKQIFAVGIKWLGCLLLLSCNNPLLFTLLSIFTSCKWRPRVDRASERSTKQTMKIDEWNFTIVSIALYAFLHSRFFLITLNYFKAKVNLSLNVFLMYSHQHQLKLSKKLLRNKF